MKKKKQFKLEMTDDQMYELLNKFINSTSTAIGGKVQIDVSPYQTHMYPREIGEHQSMKYEDTQYLHETLNGAYQFLLWARRDGCYREVK
jgi:hypothetical protein